MGEVRVYGAPSEMAGKWIREADHDAALRRAKAEGMRLAVQEQRCWEDVLRTEYRNVPTFEALIDALAAQIEEGE